MPPPAVPASLSEEIHLLLDQINTINTAWKAVRDLFGNDDPQAQALRDLKTRAQVRLLTDTSRPAYLMLDPDPELKEPAYGVWIKANGRPDGAHLPVRVAEEWLPAGLHRALIAPNQSV